MDYVWLAAGSLLLFAGLAFLWNFHDRKGKPGIAVRVAVIAAAGCICAVILKLTGLKPEWTAMEYLFGGALLVNGCAFLWRLIREGKNGITANVFRLICAVCVSCAVYSALTYGQTIINSDTATSILLPQSQIR
jgi:peptidoglycan/LPS O-acetylase OafA/YrhL